MSEKKSTRINFRIDRELKESMEETCRKMGLSMTAAYCQFCRKVVAEGKIPFDLAVDET